MFQLVDSTCMGNHACILCAIDAKFLSLLNRTPGYATPTFKSDRWPFCSTVGKDITISV